MSDFPTLYSLQRNLDVLDAYISGMNPRYSDTRTFARSREIAASRRSALIREIHECQRQLM